MPIGVQLVLRAPKTAADRSTTDVSRGAMPDSDAIAHAAPLRPVHFFDLGALLAVHT
jgi:hypothetical protein